MCAPRRRMHTRLLSSFAISSCEGLHALSSQTTRWKLARLRGGVEIATPIRPITGRLSLFPASSARHPHSEPCGCACLGPPRRDDGFTLLSCDDTDGLAPASYTGSPVGSCAPSYGWSNRLR